MAKRTKTKKLFKSNLKLEALEQRQLLAGISGSGTEVTPGGSGAANYFAHPNGNKYDQVEMTGASVSVTNDVDAFGQPAQITRVSFMDMQGDIIQAEFGGKGTLTISLDGALTGQTPTNYIQPGKTYTQGLATFTITGSDSTTNFTVFSVGAGNQYVISSLFDGTHTGGNNTADVQRLTIVADPNNPNGSTFGGIRAGNAIFSADSGVVGITAANVQVQDVVVVSDIIAKTNATPALTFGTSSQFGNVQIAGGGLVQTNGATISNTGSYTYGLTFQDGTKSSGVVDTKEVPPTTTFSGNNPLTALAKTVTLTAGVDTATGGTGNDLFVGNNTSNTTVFFSSLDKIDGGAGTDTFSIVVSAAIDTTSAVSATVTNVENIDLQSAANTITANTTAWTGVTSLNSVSSSGTNLTAATTTAITATDNALAAGAISVTGGSTVNVNAVSQSTGTISLSGAIGAVSVSSSGDYTDGANNTVGNINITGGSTVTVNLTTGITSTETTAATTDGSNFTETLSAVTVKGGSATTSVSVTQPSPVTAVNSTGTNGKIGVVDGAVTVNDVNNGDGSKAGTIASVTLNNFGNSTIDSSALTSVTLLNAGGTLGIGRGALTAVPTANTLTLNVNKLDSGVITDSEAATDDGFITVNFSATGSDSKINDISFGDATTINISGDKKMEFTNNTGIAAVTTITVAGPGASSFGTALGTGVTFTGGTGADSIIVGATTKVITTGAGNDTIEIAATALGAGGSVDAGDGTSDVLKMSDANAVTASAGTTFELAISNFERLTLTGTTAADQTVNLNNIDDLNYVNIAGVAATKTLTLASANSGFTLVADSGTSGTVAVGLANSSSNDVINVNIAASNANRTVFNLTATGVETINFATTNSNSNPGTNQHTITTLNDVDVTNINVNGNAGLALGTATGATKLAAFNASGVTKGAVSLTTGILTVDTVLTGGAGDDTLNASASTKLVTINGGAGNDTITGSATKVNTLNGGDGNDTITGGSDADIVDGGLGSNTFVADLTEVAGASTTVGAVINLGATTLTQSGVFTATGSFLASVAPTVATNTATYIFNGESSTNISVVDTLANIQNATGTTGPDYIVGSASANVITGGAGADIIVTGDGADTVVLTASASVDTVTDFTVGAAGDKISASRTALGQTFTNGNNVAVAVGASVLKEAGAAFTFAPTENVVVLTGANFANTAAVKTALEAGGSRAMTWTVSPTANADFLVVWTDGTDTYVSTVNDSNAGANVALEAGEATVINLAKLSGLTSFATGTYATGNFDFV